ncbi:MAG: nicotinate-nucleotide adenylyltransferase [Actinomycetota bacterium]|nr:nicotinate-nucleotide adenylyltransferase [Actinomycetota bacterium]
MPPDSGSALGGVGGTGRRQRIGVFGGTFDPVHIGHLVAAVGARDALKLDRVLLVVANQPWQKSDRAVSPAGHRLTMLAAAVADVDGLEASAIEIERGGESYTVDTLETLRAAEPASDLFLVVGADVVEDLPSWRRVGDVADLATLVVVTRPGVAPADAGPGWVTERVEIPGLDVSASDLRARAAAGQPLHFLVPAPAIDVIRRLNLYAGDR